MERASAPRRVEHVRGAEVTAVDDRVVVEAPLEIRLSGVPLAVVMRTPGSDQALITGFALTEGIALSPDEIADIVLIGEDEDDARWELRLAPGIEVDPERFRRNLYATSSCGVCGKASIDAVRVAATMPAPVPIDAATLRTLPDLMRTRQAAFDATGGIHAAVLFTADGEPIAAAEDVGRHNAVDKVIGMVAAEQWPLSGRALLVSGRVSFEVVQKAAVAGIGLIAAVSAPSSLAIDLGSELGMTIVGFLRGDSFNVYAGSVGAPFSLR